MAHGALADERGEQLLQRHIDGGVSGVRLAATQLQDELLTGCGVRRLHVREGLPLTEEGGECRGLQHSVELLLVEGADDEAEELVDDEVAGGAEVRRLEGEVVGREGADGLRVAERDRRRVKQERGVMTGWSAAGTTGARGQGDVGEEGEEDEEAEEKAWSAHHEREGGGGCEPCCEGRSHGGCG